MSLVNMCTKHTVITLDEQCPRCAAGEPADIRIKSRYRSLCQHTGDTVIIVQTVCDPRSITICVDCGQEIQ